MKKTIFILLLLTCKIFAQNITIEFIESKYIEAFDQKVSKKGEITLSDDEARIYYLPPKERLITLNNDTITIVTKNERITKTKNEEPNIAMMFTLFKALFYQDEQTIQRIFKVTKKDDNEVVLVSKSYSSPVSKLTYEHKNEEITKLEIIGRDKTRISIEVVGTR